MSSVSQKGNIPRQEIRPGGRAQAVDPAQGRRDPDRPVGVRPEGQRDEPGGHRRPRAPRGAPGHALGVVGVAARAVVGVLGREPVGVLVHVQQADEDRPGSREPADGLGVGRGRGDPRR